MTKGLQTFILPKQWFNKVLAGTLQEDDVLTGVYMSVNRDVHTGQPVRLSSHPLPALLHNALLQTSKVEWLLLSGCPPIMTKNEAHSVGFGYLSLNGNKGSLGTQLDTPWRRVAVGKILTCYTNSF